MSKESQSLTKHDWMLAWVNLVHAGTFLPAALDQHLRDHLGISLPEQELLSQLDKAGGETMLSELARRLYLSKAGMTKMVDRLERAGLLEREKSTADRRVTSAQLTKSGLKTLRHSRAMLEAWVEANLRALLSDDQVVQLRDALQALLEGHGRWEGQMRYLKGSSHGDEPSESD